MHIFSNNCQFVSKLWISPDKADAFLVNTHLKFSLVTKMEPLNPAVNGKPLNRERIQTYNVLR